MKITTDDLATLLENENCNMTGCYRQQILISAAGFGGHILKTGIEQTFQSWCIQRQKLLNGMLCLEFSFNLHLKCDLWVSMQADMLKLCLLCFPKLNKI